MIRHVHIALVLSVGMLISGCSSTQFHANWVVTSKLPAYEQSHQPLKAAINRSFYRESVDRDSQKGSQSKMLEITRMTFTNNVKSKGFALIAQISELSLSSRFDVYDSLQATKPLFSLSLQTKEDFRPDELHPITSQSAKNEAIQQLYDDHLARIVLLANAKLKAHNLEKIEKNDKKQS